MTTQLERDLQEQVNRLEGRKSTYPYARCVWCGQIMPASYECGDIWEQGCNPDIKSIRKQIHSPVHSDDRSLYLARCAYNMQHALQVGKLEKVGNIAALMKNVIKIWNAK